MSDHEDMTRRDVLRLAQAVAALGAGLGATLASGTGWAEGTQQTERKWDGGRLEFKLYKIGSKEPFFSTALPEDTAKQILGLDLEGGGSVQVKLTLTNFKLSEPEILNDTILRLKARPK